jgi:hypothetical protein
MSYLVAKKSKIGSKLPLYKQHLEVPLTLVGSNFTSFFLSGNAVEPHFAKPLLEELRDGFPARRLKIMFLSNLRARYDRANCDESRSFLCATCPDGLELLSAKRRAVFRY